MWSAYKLWVAREGEERSLLCGVRPLTDFTAICVPHAAYLLGLSLEPVAKCSFASLTNGIIPFFFSTYLPTLLPPSVHPVLIQVSSNILRSRCLSFCCGVTVERQNEGRGRMYGKWVTRGELCTAPAQLLFSSCPAPPCSCSAPTLPLPFIQPVPILLPLVNVWAVSERRIAPSCVARRPLVMHTLMKGDVFVFFCAIAQLPLLLLLVVAGNQKHVWPTAGMRHSFIVVTVDGRRRPPRRRLQSFLLIFPKREFMLPSELNTVHNCS